MSDFYYTNGEPVNAKPGITMQEAADRRGIDRAITDMREKDADSLKASLDLFEIEE